MPAGLTLDSKTGRITGKIEKEGKFTVKLTAKNGRGAAERGFRIVVGRTNRPDAADGLEQLELLGPAVGDAKVCGQPRPWSPPA